MGNITGRFKFESARFPFSVIQIYNCRNERVAGTSSCKQRDVMKGQALRDFLKDPNSVGKVVTLSDGGKATVSRIQPCADSLDGHCWVHFKKHPVRGTDFLKVW